MSSIKLFLLVLVTVGFTHASAEIRPVDDKSTAGQVAMTAASVESVQVFKVGKLVYKIVQMDSSLNGDLGSTVIVAVGEGAVGGAAGYGAAFVIAPGDHQTMSLRRARKVNGRIVLTLVDIEMKTIVKTVRYDANTHSLKEDGEY